MMGWQNLFHCEIQEFPRKVLDYWFPNSESYEDITKTDFTKWHGKVDVLTGGFPCQPFSLAGRRKGADDNRYLWPQMLRAIRQIHPTWVVGENVNGIKTMVESCQVTQMGRTDYLFEENHLYREESRFTLDKICADLEAEGYSVQPIVIPACAIGAPHRRDRVWIIAHRSDPRAETVQQEGQDGICSARPSTHTQCDGHSPQGHGNQRARAKKSKKRKNRPQSRSRRHGSGKTLAHTLQHRSHQVHQDHQFQFPDGARSNSLSGQWSSSHSYGNGGKTLQPSEGTERTGRKRDVQPKERSTSPEWADRLSGFPLSPHANGCGWDEGEHEYASSQKPQQGESQSSGADSPQSRWRNFPTQSPVCRGNDGIPFDVDSLTISFPKWRQESIKAYGNAWVPQVAYEIFRAIEAEENK